jgi:hypothetical protein
MTAPLPKDWADALRAQGVPEADIAGAQALALRLAEAADSHPHDPLGAADPAAFLALLREAAM